MEAVETAELEAAETAELEFAEIGARAEFPREGDIASSFVGHSVVVADIDSLADSVADIAIATIASFAELIVTSAAPFVKLIAPTLAASFARPLAPKPAASFAEPIEPKPAASLVVSTLVV